MSISTLWQWHQPKKHPLFWILFIFIHFFVVCLLEVDFSPGWTHFGPLLGAKTLQSMTISGSAPNSILWLWDLPKNQAYLAILMDFINFLPLVVVFAHLAHFGGQRSHFKLFDYFVGAPQWPPKVLNILRYPNHSWKIWAPPKNINTLKNEIPQYLKLRNP